MFIRHSEMEQRATMNHVQLDGKIVKKYKKELLIPSPMNYHHRNNHSVQPLATVCWTEIKSCLFSLYQEMKKENSYRVYSPNPSVTREIIVWIQTFIFFDRLSHESLRTLSPLLFIHSWGWKRTGWMHVSFQRESTRSETQTVSFSIWARIANSIYLRRKSQR